MPASSCADLVDGAQVVLVDDAAGLRVVDLLVGKAFVRLLELVAEERVELLRDRLGLGPRQPGGGEADLGVELVIVGDQRVGLHRHRRVTREDVAAGGDHGEHVAGHLVVILLRA